MRMVMRIDRLNLIKEDICDVEDKIIKIAFLDKEV
jgi:hypothetical protein